MFADPIKSKVWKTTKNMGPHSSCSVTLDTAFVNFFSFEWADCATSGKEMYDRGSKNGEFCANGNDGIKTTNFPLSSLMFESKSSSFLARKASRRDGTGSNSIYREREQKVEQVAVFFSFLHYKSAGDWQVGE